MHNNDDDNNDDDSHATAAAAAAECDGGCCVEGDAHKGRRVVDRVESIVAAGGKSYVLEWLG